MRTREQIHLAHDTLWAIVTGQVPNPFGDGKSDAAIRGALDVLCWALEHENNHTFKDNLAEMRQWLAEQGFELRAFAQEAFGNGDGI